MNAALGTPAGELVLKAVADRLQGACGSADSIARVGGDEFAVLLDEVVSVEDARTRAASICTAVKGHLLVQGIDVELEVRWGLRTSYGGSADELLAAAERATGGEPPARGNARTPPPPSADVVELAEAIDDGQLVLHFHPIVELSNGRVAGVEALVRWQHPERGLVMPLDFIPLAEESGLIVQLGDWVLRTGAAQAADWAARGHPLDVSINLSPLQMAAPAFADHCGALLSAMQVPLERIVLEITESTLLDQPNAARALTQLRSTGVRLALDDFGTGYCSFSYLRRFPIDMIKIDRSFISGLGKHPDDDAIVASVVSLAHNTGKTVVAEGVATTAQLAHLQDLGVEQAQGFLWTRPLPCGALELWLEARRVTEREFASVPPSHASPASVTRTAERDPDPEDAFRGCVSAHDRGSAGYRAATAPPRTTSSATLAARPASPRRSASAK